MCGALRAGAGLTCGCDWVCCAGRGVRACLAGSGAGSLEGESAMSSWKRRVDICCSALLSVCVSYRLIIAILAVVQTSNTCGTPQARHVRTNVQQTSKDCVKSLLSS